MGTKSLGQSAELYDYVVAHGSEPPDDVLRALQEETAEIGLLAAMQIDAEQGALLTWLTRAFNDQVAADPRLDATMLGRFDGLTLIRKREAATR